MVYVVKILDCIKPNTLIDATYSIFSLYEFSPTIYVPISIYSKKLNVLTWFYVSLFSLQRYQSEAKIEQVDGFAMVKEMAEEMESMMGDKIEAIKVNESKEFFFSIFSRLF